MASPFFYMNLLFQIEEMVSWDQWARLQVFARKEGEQREEMFAYLKTIDGKHLARLKEIIDQNGWLGEREIGEEGSFKLWLLIQHCDSDVEFQEKCLSCLRNAVSQGNAQRQYLASLTDRVLINRGRPQLYGTQLDEELNPLPVQATGDLDQRRREMGLESLAEYQMRAKELHSAQSIELHVRYD